MSLTLGQWLLALGTPLFLGASLLLAAGLGPRADRWAFWGWAWCSGALLFALTVHTAAWFEFPWDPIFLAPPALFCGFALCAVARLRAHWQRPVELRAVDPAHTGRRAPRERRGASRWALAAVLLAGLVWTLDRTVAADGPPPGEGAAPVAWGARVLHETGGYGERYRAELGRSALDWDVLRPGVARPLDPAPLGPTLGAWMHRVSDRPVPYAAGVPLELFAPALLAVAAGALFHAAGGWFAAALLMVLVVALPGAGSPLFDEGRGPAAAAGLCMALDGWRRFRADGRGRWALLAALGAGVAATASSEGAAIVGVVLAVGAAAAVWARLRGRAPGRATGVRPRLAAWAAALSALLAIALVAATALRTGAGPDWAGFDGAARPFPILLLWQGEERWPAVARTLLGDVLLDGRHGAWLLAGLIAAAALLRRAPGQPGVWPEMALAAAVGLMVALAIGSPRVEAQALLGLAAGVWILVPTAAVLLAERLQGARA
jgi:hypothetical protein